MSTPRPPVSAAADELYEISAPLMESDADYGWAGLILCEALVTPLRELWEVFAARDGLDPWDALWLVDDCPDFALPWLAQFHGIRLPPGMSGDVARDYIRNAGGLNKGTPAAIKAAVRPTLTGQRRVDVYPRYGGPTGVLVVTYTAETPDPARSEAVARDALPAGFWPDFVYEVRDGQSYGEALAAQPTYADWVAAWVTYQNVRDSS